MKSCPTDVMWADVLTKPLQGQKFRDMQAFLQNCPRDYDDDHEAKLLMNQLTANSLRECFGKQSKQELNRPASPICVSQRIGHIRRKTKVSWGAEEVKIFLVKGKFPVERMQESSRIRQHTHKGNTYTSRCMAEKS